MVLLVVVVLGVVLGVVLVVGRVGVVVIGRVRVVVMTRATVGPTHEHPRREPVQELHVFGVGT